MIVKVNVSLLQKAFFSPIIQLWNIKRETLQTMGLQIMEDIAAEMGKKELIDQLVKMEFADFDKTRNEGGRASCQDDWSTFEIMRTSQYETWTQEMLEQLVEDWRLSDAIGRNMIAEKYARMMASTAPEEYAALEGRLPILSDWQKQVIEQVVQIQVAWMEDFARDYPNVAQRARTIHTEQDTAVDTSYETYLRGELSTYTEQMLALYAGFIVQLSREGKNLAQMIMENTVHKYGYARLEDVKGWELP